MKALISDYAREARADMGFKHFAWVLGAIGGRFHSGTVHAYGPIYGSGAAVVEFHAGEEQAALAGNAAEAPAAASAARAGRASQVAERRRRRSETAPALASGRFASRGASRSPVVGAGGASGDTSPDSAASPPSGKPRRGPARSLPLVPHAGRDRRAVRRREQRAGFRPLRGFLPLQQRARARGAQTPARRALRPDDRRDPRHLSGGAGRCADPYVHPRRLLALARQQGVQLRGRGPSRGRGDGGDQQLRALPGGHDHGDRAPEPRCGRMALPQCRDLRRQSEPSLRVRTFGRRPSDGHVARDRLGARFRPAARPRQGRHRDQRAVRPRALRSLMAAAQAPPDARGDRPDEPDPAHPGPRLSPDRHVRRRRILGVSPPVRELPRRLDRGRASTAAISICPAATTSPCSRTTWTPTAPSAARSCGKWASLEGVHLVLGGRSRSACRLKGRPAGGRAGRPRSAGSLGSADRRESAYSKTASGSSRLSEPSKSIAASSSAATAPSIALVCEVSASIAACTRALPAAFPSPICWS